MSRMGKVIVVWAALPAAVLLALGADSKAPAATPAPAAAAPAKAPSSPAAPASAATPESKPAAPAAAPAPESKPATPAASAPASAPAAPAAAPVIAAPDTLDDAVAGKNADLLKIATSPADASPYLGPKDAPVVVNVFSDFQCPVCKRSADPIKQLVLDFPGSVKVIYRDNALEMHQRSRAAALAALAARKQGKFWQFYDAIFANTSALDDGSLRQRAQDLGLDMAQWDKDVADPKNADHLREETAAAVSLGAAATPSFFINGMRQVGWGSYRGLRDMVEREIKQSEALAASGTPLPEISAARIRAFAEKNAKGPTETAIDPDLWVKVLTAN